MCGSFVVVVHACMHTKFRIVCLISVLNESAQVSNEGAQGPLSVLTAHDVCSKVMISNLPEAAKNQVVLRLYFQSLVGQVSSVKLFGHTAIVSWETPAS